MLSVNKVPELSCNDNVNALSVVVHNGCTDLNELSLQKFNISAKQVVAHFLRELYEYFTLKKTPNELKLPLCYRAIGDPFAKMWVATVYDTVGAYENSVRELAMGTKAPSSNKAQYLPRPLGQAK
jgi:hypothetical protein